MTGMTDALIPCLLAGIFGYGLWKGVPVFDTFLEGAASGLKTAVSIAPALVCLLTAIAMLEQSGAMDFLMWCLKPAAELLRVPQELLPLALMRPISGSGATAILNSMLERFGPDSFLGRAASILQGSTETTFYTIAVYYGAVSVRRTRHTLPAALAGDFTGLLLSVAAVRLFWGGSG